MLNPNPRTRLSTVSFVTEAAAAGLWATNPLAMLVEGLNGFELRSEGDKLGVLRTIKDAAASCSIPQPFLLFRVLPSLLHSLSLPSAPSSAMLPLVLELGKLVSPSDYRQLVLEPVIRLYSSPDRGTRMALLDGLGEYSDKMDQKIVVEKVWPHLVSDLWILLQNLIWIDNGFRGHGSGYPRSYRQGCLSTRVQGRRLTATRVIVRSLHALSFLTVSSIMISFAF